MTAPSHRIRCYLIGADTLLSECGDQLLSRGHEILGVITEESRIASWAQGKGLAVIPQDERLATVLAAEPFDYLLSITHLQLISAEVLALPKVGTINFHDGPLPAHAGLNAPAWALLAGDDEFGVTWHEVDEGVDTGRILVQERFPIAPEETSFTLNMKCFEAALGSFGVLLQQLEQGQLQPVVQTGEGRSIHRRADRPEAAGAIDWNDSAEHIARVVRALDFGEGYRNPLACARLMAGEQVYVVRAAEVLAGGGDLAPGEIGPVAPTGMEVGTGEGVLKITRLATQCGKALAPDDFTRLAGVTTSARLTVLDAALRSRLTQCNQAMARAEPRWIRALQDLDAYELPLAGTGGGGAAGRTVPLRVPAAFQPGVGVADPGAALQTAIAGFLGRLGDTDSIQLVWWDSELQGARDGLEPWLGGPPVVRLDLPRSAPLLSASSNVANAIRQCRRDQGWQGDALARHPETRGVAAAMATTAMATALVGLPEGVGCDQLPDDLRERLESLARVVFLLAADGASCAVLASPDVLSDEACSELAGQLEAFLTDVAARPEAPLGELAVMPDAIRATVLGDWNQTSTEFDPELSIHGRIEQQVAETPDAVAVFCEGHSLSYRELDRLAAAYCAELRGKGLGPGDRVGICLERSVRLVAAVLGVLKSGAAYVPLDPDFPAERIALMGADSGLALVLVEPGTRDLASDLAAPALDVTAVAPCSGDAPESHRSAGRDLAYMIYTSGSTGRPKGVMVEHRQVGNFFTGMDARVSVGERRTWLAVTSLSFDISVLELLWTLTRGFKVVVHRDRAKESAPVPKSDNRPIDFSIFLWGSDGEQGDDKYRVMLDAARFADQNDFLAIWTPERHFHAFGGPYANPSISAAAIAAVTERLRIRSGSIVLPLHHPVRVVEEWSMVDNLSGGRVDLGVASGWQPDDFLFRPENHPRAKEVLFEGIDQVRALWRGERLEFPVPNGKTVAVLTQPRPLQNDVQIWIASAGNPETYQRAGAIGANILTHLLGQSVEQVAEKVAIYRDSLEAAGFPRDHGKVTLMLHTFVGESDEAVRDTVRGPLKNYLGSSVHLAKKYAASFPTFRDPTGKGDAFADMDLNALPAEDFDAIIEYSFLRYFETSGLMGSFERCQEMVGRCKDIGVDEVGCLIDYGVDPDTVLASLPALAELRRRCQPGPTAHAAAQPEGDYSIPALLRDHDVSHMQCTPSMARMFLSGGDVARELGRLECMLLGGEALPPDLLQAVRKSAPTATVLNMYGPTETTVWSAVSELQGDEVVVPIGTPIANTRLYVLDGGRQPMPPGVAGDLWIAGDGVTRGYHERSDLTAERFVMEPFGAGPHRQGQRMYATGDRARWRRDGVLEFLGRDDHQVKVRGYRIELGEIEAVLQEHEAVHSCAVIAREDAPGDVRIVAYPVAAPDTQVGEELERGLLAQARRRLPAYMVPAHMVFLDALPLTPNGKLDRKALPAPGGRAVVAAPEAAADTPLEQQLVGLWQETLALDRISIDGNFFDLGGHSLLLVKMHRGLQEMLERRVDLTLLYQYPTIRSLAAALQPAAGGDGAAADGQTNTPQGAQQGKSRAARRRAMQRRR